MFVIVSRCDTKVKSCQHIQNIRINKICEKFVQENQLWSSFFEAIKPPLKCPIEAGLYELNNAPIDLTSVSRFLDNYKWIAIIKFFSGRQKIQKEVLCFTGLAEFVDPRKRSRLF